VQAAIPARAHATSRIRTRIGRSLAGVTAPWQLELLATALDRGRRVGNNSVMSLLARDLMQATTLTVPADLPFVDVQHLFIESQVSGAPVLDAAGAVLGLITATELLQAVDQALDEDVDPGEPADLEDRLGMLTAAELATPDVVWIPPTMPAREIAQLMQRDGVHRVLVGEPGRLAGIVTTFDLLRAVS
jgi:CBS domain-containing protein